MLADGSGPDIFLNSSLLAKTMHGGLKIQLRSSPKDLDVDHTLVLEASQFCHNLALSRAEKIVHLNPLPVKFDGL